MDGINDSSAGVTWVALVTTACAALLAAVVLAAISARRGDSDTRRIECARSEANALLLHVTGTVVPGQLLEAGTIHKRVWTAADAGQLRIEPATFAPAVCAGSANADAPARRRFAVDPWGTAYWIRTMHGDAVDGRVLVYSFGPNRRRAGDAGDIGPSRGDDVVVIDYLRTAH